LVMFRGQTIPAELAVLQLELRSYEKGAWLNSRSTTRGVDGLVSSNENGIRYKTSGCELPGFVTSKLDSIYREAMLTKGCPDLVIWRTDLDEVRLVEVKNSHWDRLSQEQISFRNVAERLSVKCKTVEWEFAA
jgi:hypothetical protein